jgi:hypothetical protein
MRYIQEDSAPADVMGFGLRLHRALFGETCDCGND